jgi:hypothetical protein
MKLIAIRIAAKKAAFSKSFPEAVPSRIRVKHLEKQPLLRTSKKCPDCAAQVPVSALLCDACEYNFIANMAIHRHKLLNPPTVSESVRTELGMSKVAIFTARSVH